MDDREARLAEVIRLVKCALDEVDVTRLQYVAEDIGLPTSIRDAMRDGVGYSEYGLLGRGLVNYGFSYVGHGNFSLAVSHPLFDGVIKLSINPTDDYPSYAWWLKGRHNRHAPTIYARDSHKGVGIFALKRYITLEEAEERGLLPDHFRVTQVTTGAYWPDKPATATHRRSLIRFVKKIIDSFDNIDIHSDNMMFDPDTRTVIVTDPVSFSE